MEETTQIYAFYIGRNYTCIGFVQENCVDAQKGVLSSATKNSFYLWYCFTLSFKGDLVETLHQMAKDTN